VLIRPARPAGDSPFSLWHFPLGHHSGHKPRVCNVRNAGSLCSPAPIYSRAVIAVPAGRAMRSAKPVPKRRAHGRADDPEAEILRREKGPFDCVFCHFHEEHQRKRSLRRWANSLTITDLGRECTSRETASGNSAAHVDVSRVSPKSFDGSNRSRRISPGDSPAVLHRPARQAPR